MILGEVFQALQPWQRLSGMRMRPQVAYKILRHVKAVSAEYDIIEKQRTAMIHRITNTEEGQDAKIEPDTPEFETYFREFNEVLTTESELKPLNMSLEKVLDAVGKDQDDVLSVADMMALEPFFTPEEEQAPEAPPVAGKIGD